MIPGNALVYESYLAAAYSAAEDNTIGKRLASAAEPLQVGDDSFLRRCGAGCILSLLIELVAQRGIGAVLGALVSYSICTAERGLSLHVVVCLYYSDAGQFVRLIVCASMITSMLIDGRRFLPRFWGPSWLGL